MSQPTIRSDINQSFDIPGHFPPQVSFHLIVRLQVVGQPGDLFIGEILGACVRIHTRGGQRGLRRGASDPEDVSQRNFNAFFLWDFNPDNPWHPTSLCVAAPPRGRRAVS